MIFAANSTEVLQSHKFSKILKKIVCYGEVNGLFISMQNYKSELNDSTVSHHCVPLHILFGFFFISPRGIECVFEILHAYIYKGDHAPT